MAGFGGRQGEFVTVSEVNELLQRPNSRPRLRAMPASCLSSKRLRATAVRTAAGALARVAVRTARRQAVLRRGRGDRPRRWRRRRPRWPRRRTAAAPSRRRWRPIRSPPRLRVLRRQDRKRSTTRTRASCGATFPTAARSSRAARPAPCAGHQRMLTIALKRARHVALLPFTAEHIHITGVFPSRG